MIKNYSEWLNESVNESKVTITKLNPSTFRLEVDSKFGQTTLTAGSEKEAREMKSKIEKAFREGKIQSISSIGYRAFNEADEIDADELAVGKEVEMEHTDDEAEAEKIAKDHLAEDPHYYKKLGKAGLIDEPEALQKAAELDETDK